MAVLHVVLFAFKQETTDDQRRELHQKFTDLLSQIEGVESVDIGKNFLEQGSRYTDAAVVRMKDREALAAYGPHDRHQEVGRAIRPHMEDVLVVDIEV